MELHIYLAFILATIIMIALPGPSILLTVSHSISFGWQRALATVAGETLGVAVQLVVAAIGLVSLLNAVAGVFEWLRWAGAAYLVYLGIRQWLSAGKPLELESAPVTNTNLFSQGLVITIFNPKSLIFIAAFMPQFIDAGRPMGLQFALIAPTFFVITFTVASVWALVTGKVSRFLQDQPALLSVNRIAGGLMILAGAGLALARRS